MKKFDCRKIEDILPLYIEGSLSEEEAKEVEKHLASCERCFSSYEKWRRFLSALENLPRLQAPDALWYKIKEKLPIRERRKPVWLSPLSALAGLSLALTLLFIVFSRQTRTSAPLMTTPQTPYQATLPTALPKKEKPLPPKIGKSLHRAKKIATLAKAQRKPSATVSRGVYVQSRDKAVQEKLVERLEMALLSATQAESGLERALKVLEGEKVVNNKGGEKL
ncbi:MAG: anti-sigma factor family protein [bacterium]